MTNYKNAVGRPTFVKNRRLRISPGGVISLPVAARKALGMTKGEGARVTIAVDGSAAVIARAGETGGARVSSGGQLELRTEALALLGKGSRYYWIELLDEQQLVKLRALE